MKFLKLHFIAILGSGLLVFVCFSLGSLYLLIFLRIRQLAIVDPNTFELVSLPLFLNQFQRFDLRRNVVISHHVSVYESFSSASPFSCLYFLRNIFEHTGIHLKLDWSWWENVARPVDWSQLCLFFIPVSFCPILNIIV